MTTLYAHASGNLSEIEWYDAPSGGNVVDVDWFMGGAAEHDFEANANAVVVDIGSIAVPLVCTSLRTLLGGGFTTNLASWANRALYCDLLAGTTPCLTIAGNTYSLRLLGSSTGGSATGAHGLVTTSTNTVTIEGDCTGGSASAYGALLNASQGTIIANGTCRGGSHNAAFGLVTVGAGSVNHCIGSATHQAAGVSFSSQYYSRIVRGTVDWTAKGLPTGGYAPTFAASARHKTFGADGVTPIYFRPHRGRGILTGGSL